jgi:hypothetical protein
MAKASRDPYFESREVKRQSLIDTLYQIVDEIISEMPLKENVSLANMKREDIEVLQSVFDLYVRDKIESEDSEDMEYENIMNKIWNRLRETHSLRVVK